MPGIVLPHVGRSVTVQSCDAPWTLSRWTLAVDDEFADWAKTKLRDPLELSGEYVKRLIAEERGLRKQLEADPKNEELQGKIADLEAMQTHYAKIGLEKACGYLSITSPEMAGLIASPRGAARMLWLLLRENHEGITEDDAKVIQENADPQELQEAFRVARGKVPPAQPKNGRCPAPTAG